MGSLNYNYKQVTKKLTKLGFRLERQCEGSHELRFNESKGEKVILYKHGSKTLSKGIIKKIIKSIGLTNDEFKKI